MLFLIFLLAWLAAPVVELGVIIALWIRNDRYKKQIMELSRQRDGAVLEEALEKAQERAREESLALGANEPLAQKGEEPLGPIRLEKPLGSVLGEAANEPQEALVEKEAEAPPAPLAVRPGMAREAPALPAAGKRDGGGKGGNKGGSPMGTAAMVIGVVLVVLAGLVFATTTWRILPSACKALLVAVFCGIFYLASFLAETRLHLYRTGNAFYVLGSTFVFLTVLAVAYFQLLGPGFVLEGSARWSVLWAGSLLTVVMLFLGTRRFCDRIYIQSCFWGMSVTVSFLMMALEADWGQFLSGMAIYASLLAAGEEVLRKHVQGLDEMGGGGLLLQGFSFFSAVHFWFFALLMAVYGVATGFYGVGFFSGGWGVLAMGAVCAGAAFQAERTEISAVKAFASLAAGGAVHSLGAWLYAQAVGWEDWLFDAIFSGWEILAMILATELVVALCLWLGHGKRLWSRGGDGVFLGFLGLDTVLLGISAAFGPETESWRQLGALAGAAVFAAAAGFWSREVPLGKRCLPFVFWYMLLPIGNLLARGWQGSAVWTDRGALEFLLLAALTYWDSKKKSGFQIAALVIGTVAQAVYFSKTQASFPFFLLLSAYFYMGKGRFHDEAASLCAMVGTYLLAWPFTPGNGVLRGIIVIGVSGACLAFDRKKGGVSWSRSLFWDCCGCVLMLGLWAGFYGGGNLKVWNLLPCLAAFWGFYLMFYAGGRSWPHLLIALAMLPVPAVLALRYHWGVNLLYGAVGGWYLLTGAVSQCFCPIARQEGQGFGGWRVDWHRVLAVFVLAPMATSAEGAWRFWYLFLMALYFLQYAGVEAWKRPAWCGCAGALLIGFWSQPFIDWPAGLAVEICLLPLGAYVWLLGRIWNGRKEVTWLQDAGYIFCLLVLGVNAWLTGKVVNALILEGICLAVFLWAQVKKERLWVRVSGGIMVTLALYMTKGFWLSISWWVYLLAAGIGLIIFAAMKEK